MGNKNTQTILINQRFKRNTAFKYFNGYQNTINITHEFMVKLAQVSPTPNTLQSVRGHSAIVFDGQY